MTPGDSAAKAVISTAQSKLLAPRSGEARPRFSCSAMPLPMASDGLCPRLYSSIGISRAPQRRSLVDLDLTGESTRVAAEVSCMNTGGRDCDTEGATRHGDKSQKGAVRGGLADTAQNGFGSCSAWADNI